MRLPTRQNGVENRDKVYSRHFLPWHNPKLRWDLREANNTTTPLTALLFCLWVWLMDSAENARFVLSQTKWPFLNCVATSENSGIQVFHVLIMWTRRYA